MHTSKIQHLIRNIFIVAGLIVFFTLIIYLAFFTERVRTNIDDYINNPAFTGMVVSRGIVPPEYNATRRTIYLIRIVGVFTEGNEETHVERLFRVSEEMFHQFRVGDVISYPQFTPSSYLFTHI